MRRFATALTLVIVMMTALPASAQSLADAIELEESGHLIDALDAFEETLRASGNSRRDLRTIFRHLSVLRFASGDNEGTRDAVMRLLAIAPSATLPDSAPPELQELFEEASTRWESRTLRAQASQPDEDEMVLLVEVEDDLMEMVAGVEVTSGSQVIGRAEGYGSEFEVTLDADALEDEEVAILLVNEHGGILWEGAHELEVSGGSSPPRRERGPRRSTGASWHRGAAWALIGVGLAAVIGGAVLIGIDDTSTGEQRTSGVIIYERYRTTLTGGAILLGLGGASAIAGLVWLLIHRRRASESTGDDESMILQLSTR